MTRIPPTNSGGETPKPAQGIGSGPSQSLLVNADLSGLIAKKHLIGANHANEISRLHQRPRADRLKGFFDNKSTERRRTDKADLPAEKTLKKKSRASGYEGGEPPTNRRRR